MHIKASLLLMILILLGFLIFSGCMNAAAENLADDCWKFRQELLLQNENFSTNERELFLIEVMQANGFDEGEIVTEIEKLRAMKNIK